MMFNARVVLRTMGSQSVSVAVGVVFDDHGNVMLARTTYGTRSIGPPGGRIEQGESPELQPAESSARNRFEIHVDGLIGIYSFTDQDHEAIVHAFLCSIVGGELRIQRDEISEVIWSDPRSLPEPADLVGPFAIADALDHNWGVIREGLVWRPASWGIWSRRDGWTRAMSGAKTERATRRSTPETAWATGVSPGRRSIRGSRRVTFPNAGTGERVLPY